MPTIQVVPIEEVAFSTNSSSWHIRKMKEVLMRQGQIEPLQVYPYDGGVRYATFEQDAWANEIVAAAHALKWPTLLVVITDKYLRS